MKNILIYQENICWNLLIVYLAALSEHTVIIVEIIQYKLKKTTATSIAGPAGGHSRLSYHF